MTPAGLDRLKRDEGLSLTAYPDPITKGAPWTIGYGATGPKINKDTIWTQAQADGDILSRVNFIQTQLSNRMSFFDKLSPVRQDVLINIAYNIGIAGLIKWTITLVAASRYDYVAVADDIRTNKVWKSEVGSRVDRCASAFELGTW